MNDRIIEGVSLKLPFGPELYDRCEESGLYIYRKYNDPNKPKIKSKYRTTPHRQLVGRLGETAIAEYLGVPQADYRRPWESAYDVWPDIEIRSTEYKRPEWLSLELWISKDAKKGPRRWVLADVRFDDLRPKRGWVTYHGYQTTEYLRQPKPWPAQPKPGLLGWAYPDELLAMDELLQSVRRASVS